MLKIKDTIDLKKLYYFGFKLEPEKAYYEKEMIDFKIFVWIKKGDRYLPRHIYIENVEGEPILFELDVLYDLIQAGLVEKSSFICKK